MVQLAGHERGGPQQRQPHSRRGPHQWAGKCLPQGFRAQMTCPLSNSKGHRCLTDIGREGYLISLNGQHVAKMIRDAASIDEAVELYESFKEKDRADRIHEKYAHMVTLMLVPSSPR